MYTWKAKPYYQAILIIAEWKEQGKDKHSSLLHSGMEYHDKRFTAQDQAPMLRTIPW